MSDKLVEQIIEALVARGRTVSEARVMLAKVRTGKTDIPVLDEEEVKGAVMQAAEGGYNDGFRDGKTAVSVFGRGVFGRGFSDIIRMQQTIFQEELARQGGR